MKQAPQLNAQELMLGDYPMGIMEQLASKEAELQMALEQVDLLKQQINSLCQRSAQLDTLANE